MGRLSFGALSRRGVSWIAAGAVASAAFVYGAVDEGPPKTNADRVHALAQNFACPVCAGQSVADSDVPVAREIRRQMAVWVDEGRSDEFIQAQLVAAYDADIAYSPSGSGVTSLVWILPVVVAAGMVAVLGAMLRSGGRATTDAASPAGGHSAPSESAPGAVVQGVSASFGAGSPEAPRRWRNALVWTAALLLLGAAGGVLVARSSGSRGADGSITGDIRNTTRELIFDAQRRLREADTAGAVSAYEEALKLQPSNPEALAYRGWLESRVGGDLALAARYLDDAIAVDPDYADARLFRSIVALDSGDAARAAVELQAFDSLDPPPFARQLVDQAQVRERIAAAGAEAAWQAVKPFFEADDSGRSAFSATGLTAPEALSAVEHLASQGRVLDGLQLLDWVLGSYPRNATALAARGWLLARTEDPELLDRGVALLDEVLTADPANAWALVYRAIALLHRGAPGDRDAARADLAAFDSLADRPADLVRLIESQGLRDLRDGG